MACNIYSRINVPNLLNSIQQLGDQLKPFSRQVKLGGEVGEGMGEDNHYKGGRGQVSGVCAQSGLVLNAETIPHCHMSHQ